MWLELEPSQMPDQRKKKPNFRKLGLSPRRVFLKGSTKNQMLPYGRDQDWPSQMVVVHNWSQMIKPAFAKRDYKQTMIDH